MSVIRIKVGDDLPVISDSLTYSDESVPDLAGATVRFIMRGPWAATPKIDAAATVLDQNTVPGGVQYVWQPANVDTPGEYRAEWRVTFANAKEMTFPTSGTMTVIIESSQADVPVRRLYCTRDDLVLGDLELSSRLDPQDYIRRASRDVDVVLARRYVVPVPSTAAQQTQDLLTSVTADLASAYILMSVATGGEDNMTNAYGMHLFNRAMTTLGNYVTGDSVLAGVETAPNPGSSSETGPVAIRQEDPESLIAGFYQFTNPDYAGVPVFGPAVRPYGL